MRGKIVLAGLILALCAGIAPAQDVSAVANENDLYCSGVVTTEAVPRDSFVITGEEADTTLTYALGDTVYVNKGSNQGIRVGEVFSVIRPTVDAGNVEWTKWQYSTLKKMGTMWEDEGRLTITVVRPDVSIAQITHSCNDIQRGDIVLPFIERPTPPGKTDLHFDRIAPANGKPLAMVMVGKKYAEEVGTRDIVYVNLGNLQGVRVGDYFRIFRYTGMHHEVAYQDPRFAFDVDRDLGPTWGFGGVSKKYNWSNVPRQDVGEGVVLRTGPNSSTVMITFSNREISAGDYAEVE